MKTTNSSIKYTDKDGNNVEEVLLTYDDEEQQQNIINAENAKLIFSPKFIPIYPELLGTLTLTEALIFGFIDFYKHNSSVKFYFTDEQIAEIAKCSPSMAGKAINKLVKLNFIETKRKLRSGGGKVRFVTRIIYDSDSQKSTTPTSIKVRGNNNKINNNKINNILSNKLPELPINDIIKLFEPINPSYRLLFSNKTERAALERLCKQHGVEAIKWILDRLPTIITQPYAPKITTPYQLEKDLGKLKAYLQQQSSNKSIAITI